MQQLGANSNLARVHVEGGDADADANDGKRGETPERPQDEPEDPGAWTGRIVQQLSGVWGYAVIGSAFNLSLVAGLSSLEWTNWGGDGTKATNEASSSSASEGETQSMPMYNKWTMGVFMSLICSVVLSLRTTFAVAANDPYLLPSIVYKCRRYARHCFIFMLVSSLCVAGLLYILPISLGAQMHYYFADVVPILLSMSVCVVFTAEAMRFFYRRDHQQGGDTAVHEQSQNDVGDNEDHGDEEERKGLDCYKQTLRQLNITFIGLFSLGC